jgi:spermidine synthase
VSTAQPAFDFEVIAAEETPLGLIWLRQRRSASDPGGVALEISLDHQFLMSSATTASERALSEQALARHPGTGLRALVGGLGLGATAHELLRSPRVARVCVVELLQPIIDWLERGQIPLAGELRSDARFAVERDDVYARLLGPPAALHDLILIDVDHSPDERLGPSSASFYAAESLGFEQALRAVFSEVHVLRSEFANGVDGVLETNWVYLARG